MRDLRFAVRLITVVAVFSVSAIGQQPANTVLLYPNTSIDLQVEPAHLKTDISLADAARRNDFPKFHAIYSTANPNDAANYSELHDFWQWSLTDPVGAFYGADTHAKFAARYRDYAGFIEDYSIVDSHGNVFYPSAETRTFLLQHAMSETVPPPSKAPIIAVAKPKPRVVRDEPIATAAAQPEPAQPIAPVLEPPLEEPLPQPVTPAVAALMAPPAVRPVPRAVAPGARPVTPQPIRTSRPVDGRLARGLAMIIAGLIAVGMLTLMLRTPGEETPAREDSMESMRFIKIDRSHNDDSGSHSSVA